MAQSLDKVIKRYQHIFDKNTKAGCLIGVTAGYDLGIPGGKSLEQYNFPADSRQCAREQLENKLLYWEKTDYFKDDSIKSTAPFFGMQEHSSFFGGKVSYGGNTSYIEPVLNDYNDLNSIKFNQNNPNYQMLLDGMEYYKELESKYDFKLCLRGGSCAMEMANAVRGNDYFMDFYDDPDGVKNLNELCLHAQMKNFENQWKIVGPSYDGVMAGFGIWLPSHAAGHISEDASSMCSPDIYSEFGAPYTKRFLDNYDCAMMHIHVMGRHILPQVSQMKKIKCIQFQIDPNQELSSFDYCRQNEEYIKDTVMILQLKEDEIKNNLDYLKTHKTIIWYTAPNKEKGLEMIDLIHSLF